MKAWVVKNHGGLEALEFCDRPKPAAGTDECVVRVHAVGLNHLDIWVRKGVAGHKFPLPIIPGCDVAGVVEETGQEVIVAPGISCGKCSRCSAGQDPLCENKYQIIGETRDGGCAEFLVAPKRNLIAKPKDISFEAAACIGIPFLTAYSMLFEKAKIQSGEWAVIHSAGGGVGSSAIQLAKRLGVNVITTVGSQEKAAPALALGADHVLLTSDPQWSQKAKSIVKSAGKFGVDVIIDHLGGKIMEDGLRILGRGGRYVLCGATTHSEISLELKSLFFKNISILGSTMGSLESLREIVRWMEWNETLRPVVARTFEFDSLPAAHAALESRKFFGKIAMRIPHT